MLEALAAFWQLLERGGLVVWPLLALSVIAMTLSLERALFFLQTNRRSRLQRLGRLRALLRKGDQKAARILAENDRSLYGQIALQLLDEGATEAVAIEAVEAQRQDIERFMPTLSTIITAAPMLGILGTVIGIIRSFENLGDSAATGDPGQVSLGIAEALITTAVGLVVALITLFPYNAFRTQVDRTLSRAESLASSIIAIETGGEAGKPKAEAA